MQYQSTSFDMNRIAFATRIEVDSKNNPERRMGFGE